MARPRRSISEPRLELTPLLDLMFLLLTFFIFAFVLMVRLKVTDIRLPPVTGGQAVENTPVVVVALSPTGELKVDDRAVARADLAGAIAQAQTERPGAKLLIAVDEGAASGALFKLMDDLRAAGFQDLRFLRLPEKDAPVTPGPPGPSDPPGPTGPLGPPPSTAPSPG